MAYTKPGVLINQVQETISPALVEPDLYAGVIGRPYYVFKPGDVDTSSAGYWNPVNGELDINLNSLVTTQYPQISGVIDAKSIYVDFVGVSGVAAGQKINGSYDNANSGASGPTYDASYSNGTLTVSGVSDSTYADSAFRVNVGFRILRHDLQKAVVFTGGSDIQEAIGPVSVFNELGAALTISTANSNRRTYAYGTTGTMDSGTQASDAQDALSSKDIYAFAPLASNWADAITSWKVFVETQSTPENKRESVVVATPRIPWRDNEYGATTTSLKLSTAQDIAGRAAITQSKRLVMIHPDVAYVRETLHISQIKQSYLASTLGDDGFYTDYGLYARLTGSVTLSDGSKYFADDEVTDVVWQKLSNDRIEELTVLVPIPGYMLASAVVGQISAQDPEQPLTRIPVVGIERVRYSSDWFSDAQLDVMAEGGTYIMVQDQETLPVYCRHQLTTDTTSVETREISIQKSIDFVSKFLRRNMRSLVGRNNITPQFIKTLTTIVKGIGVQLIRDGVLADFRLAEIKQDETQKDRIKMKISVLASYPSNYIDIDLIY